MKIIPSILVQSEQEFLEQISAVKNILDMVQLDIADGKFVDNTTWADPEIVKTIDDINIELHLMIQNPLEEIKRWKDVKQIKRILVHYESVEDFEEIIPELKSYDWEIGIVLNPDTNTAVLLPFLDDIKSVMFMGVIPGKQGQKLIPEVLTKIKNFKSENPDKFTELDGGVNLKTLPDIINSGVDAICPGSTIFRNANTPEENIKILKNIIKK
jgi:ribulose-phosphate 3-epimerase